MTGGSDDFLYRPPPPPPPGGSRGPDPAPDRRPDPGPAPGFPADVPHPDPGRTTGRIDTVATATVTQAVGGADHQDGVTPGMFLGLATLVALAGGLVALVLGESITLALVGWAAAGPVAIVLLGAYRLTDTRRRSAGLAYSEPPWVRVLRPTTVVVIVAGIACAAWRIAQWAGRL